MRRYTERISFNLPSAEKAELKQRAKRLGVSMSELVRHATEVYGVNEARGLEK